MTAWLLLVAALLLIAAAGVFVAAEFSFVTVDRSQVEQAAATGDAGARGLLEALRTLSTQLSGAQVGITITNLAIGYLAEPAIAELVDGPLAAAGVPDGAVTPVAVTLGLTLGTILTMIFGELVPKNLALAKPMAVARSTQRFQRTFTAVARGPIRVLNGSANAAVRRLGIEPQEELRSARSSTELASLIQRSADLGTLDVETAELMERSVEFGARTAGEIMTPRVRSNTLEVNDRAADVIQRTRESGHSRFPVLDAEENVVGTVHVKNAVALPVGERATTKVKHLMAKPIIVPDSLRLDPLLALLRKDGFQLAVVMDEYGGFAGIVTLEDVVEEIVGDISDEHDRSSSNARQLRDGSWSLSGLLRPDEVDDLTGIMLPDHEDYDTTAGLVLRVLGRVPAVGDQAEVLVPDRSDPDEPREQTAVLTVERMDGLRIDRVSLRLVPPAAADGTAGPGADRATGGPAGTGAVGSTPAGRTLGAGS
jgi:CBS domain containing-hemolysin-like protein